MNNPALKVVFAFLALAVVVASIALTKKYLIKDSDEDETEEVAEETSSPAPARSNSSSPAQASQGPDLMSQAVAAQGRAMKAQQENRMRTERAVRQMEEEGNGESEPQNDEVGERLVRDNFGGEQ